MSLSIPQESCGCDDKHEDVIKFLKDKVDETFLFRDRYFESHSIEQAINKNKDIEDLIGKNIEIFNKHEKTALESNKAYYTYLRGKLLNVFPTYSKDAEALLSKAIKLDPKLVDAWNELGECYCKNDDIQKAKSCFEGAMKEKRNKVALRSLSMLIRQELSNKPEEKLKLIEKGLTFAKEAVQLDPHDGISWSVLGNAHLCFFFGVQQNPATLKQCLGAYAQADKDIVARSSPDLHYNKATIFKFQEEFKTALENYNEASSYDPTWETPLVKEKLLLAYLQDIQDLVQNKGKLKPKKFQQILQALDSKQLGPYGGGYFTSSTGDKLNLEEVSYDSLKPGVNKEKVILGKVICSVWNEEGVPFTFCSVDKAGTVIVTTVFNLAAGKGVIIGDSVAIPEPFLNEVDFSYKDKTFKFKLIRVEAPVIMVVNSKKLGKDLQADIKMSISRKFD